MKKSNLSYKTHFLCILAILCLLLSYLWIAPSQVHALSAGFQEYYVLGNEEQTYMTGEATTDNQMAYYDHWKDGYEAGLRSSVFASGGKYLWSTDPLQTDRLSLSISKGDVPQAPGESNPSAPLRAPTLAVDIVSSPWATVDHNGNPGVGDGELPEVFVVEAVITNTGAITDVAVHLDFNPGNGWTLLGAEDPDRIAEDLAPGTAYHAYWLVRYPHLPPDIGATHQYTVTAAPVGDLADSVAASATVATRETLGPANQAMTHATAEVVVGVAFTVTVGFDLGTGAQDVVLSPVGNPDFDPGNYRLMASEVRFYNDAGTWQEIVPDRLYFPTLDSSAENAEVTYTFLALAPETSRLCPYAGISFGTTNKYDQNYCSESSGTIISIEGEVSLSLTKEASSSTIQQDQPLTYTIYYTNTGDLPLSYVWIWDDVDTNIGSIITTSINPASDPGETTDSRVAWYLDDVGSSGQVTSTGTLAFTILIDGDNQYLADHPLLVNHAFLGFNPGSLPQNAALTSTVTTTIQVPVLTITKSDFPDPVLVGRLITYTLHYTNSGSAPATNVLITDVVPLSTTYQTCSGGSACGMSSGVVSWNIGTVPSNTNNATVSFSVLVSDTLATGTLILNEDYGIFSDQTGFIPGSLVTTGVSREAAFIDGYAFQDDDCDGFHDTGEGGLSGIAVTLPSATVPVATTGEDGYYHFRVEIQKPVSVTAALPTGYFRTTPGTVFLESTLGITQTVNFGYALSDDPTCGVIYGTVFEDANHDGVQSGGEYGLSNVTVTSTEAVTSPVTTNQVGQYTFRYNASGAVTIVETNLPFYVSTTPDVVHTSAVFGSSGPSPIDFGDFLGIKVTGQVFDDVNVNGVNNAEAGVSGATVAAGIDSFLTDSSGVYTLYVTVNDSNPIAVTETDPAGYVSTNAIPGAGMSKVDANTLRIDSPISGTVYSGGDFGDVLAGSVVIISGQVWDDNGAGGGGLANGLHDGTEPGLAGAIVGLSSGLSATTGSDGLFTLPAPANQAIIVAEINPVGYISTNAIPGNDAIKVDNDTLRIRPLGAGSTSAGNLFGDVLASSLGGIYLPIIMKNH
ncbi:MAG: DUF11 domain-containing protein [Anaerolineae bacterium]|nr:DUF11 domain-containing protein [Anaerolineae bacterium]